MPPNRAAQLAQIARLRRLVGLFARGGDREATAEALLELSKQSRDGAMRAEAVKRARQAAELLAEEDPTPTAVASLLRLASLCLENEDLEAAISAAEVAKERAALLGARRNELIGGASLLAGIARALNGDDEAARAHLDEARELMVAAKRPDGAAVAIMQLGMLDAAAERYAPAQICFQFACDFYRAADQYEEAAEVGALAGRVFVDAKWGDPERWLGLAIADADRARSPALAAQLVAERAEQYERTGKIDEARAAADGVATRCREIPNRKDAIPIILRARVLLARLSTEPIESMRHAEGAFELALDTRNVNVFADVLELVVNGLVKRRYGAAGWRLVSRFRERLTAAGYHALAETAETALRELYPFVADEIEAEEPQKLRDRPPAPVNDGDIDKDEAAND
jgi:hypothetical protein